MDQERQNRKEELKKVLDSGKGLTGANPPQKSKFSKPKITKWFWVLGIAFILFLIFQFGIRGCI